MKRIRLSIALSLSVLFGFAGCASFPSGVFVNSAPVGRNQYAPPGDNAIICGYVSREDLLGREPIEMIEYAQTNPALSPIFLYPARTGYFFYTNPIPIGSHFSMIHFRYRNGQITTYRYVDLNIDLGMNFTVDKPGIRYLGSFIYGSGSDGIINLSGPSNYRFRPQGPEKESDALRSLYSIYRGTEWQEIIALRQKEIGK